MPRDSRITRQEPILAALPASPSDGQVINLLVDAANGVVWRLRYRADATGTYKWDFLGGAPLRSEVVTQEVPGTGAYADIATVGPSVTVPLAGDYDIVHGARIGGSTSGFAEQSVAIGAATALDADGARASGSTGEYNVTRQLRKTGIASGTVLRAKYRASVATMWAAERWLIVTPVRVG